MTSKANTFRFIFWPRDYQASVDFYRDMLECPMVMDWDNGPENRGSVFKLGSGEIEMLALAPGKEAIDPKGFELYVEVPDVDAHYQFVQGKGIALRGEIADKPWGHRTFSIGDPNGIKVIFFSAL